MGKKDTNLCVFTGNLVRDPETKYTTGGDAVTNFTIGCGWTSKNGEGTEFVRCVAWRKLAEICNEYLKKGKPVLIRGRMQTRKWERDGQDQYTTEIVLDEMQMLGGGESRSGESRGSYEPQPGEDDGPDQASEGEPTDDFDDDIPF